MLTLMHISVVLAFTVALLGTAIKFIFSYHKNDL